MSTYTDAPASVTYSITSKDGFNALFSLREETGEALLSKMAVVESKLLALQYKPQIKTFGAKKELDFVEGKKCPKCGGRLVKKISSVGKPFHKCENGKWDFTTKQATGCDFVDWLNPVVGYDKTDPYKDGGMSKEQMDDYEV